MLKTPTLNTAKVYPIKNATKLMSIILIASTSFFAQNLVAKSVSHSQPTISKTESYECKNKVSQAASLFAQGKNLEAADLLRQWSNRCPHNAQFHLLLSTILLRLGHHLEEAELEASRATEAEPNSVASHLQLGLVSMANGNNLKAALEFERVVELEPSSYEAWSSLASLYGTLHEDEKATKCAAKAADLEPGTRMVRLRLLKNLERTGKIKEATLELEKLINSNESSPEFVKQLADEALSIGAYDQAIQASIKVLEAYPKSATALKTLALAQLYKHDFDSCLKTAKKMIDLDTDNSEGHAFMGLSLVKLDQLKEGEKELNYALGHKGNLGLALLGLGNLQLAKGQYQDVTQTLGQAVDVDPSLEKNADFCLTWARALDKQGDGELASAYYKRGLDLGLLGEDAKEARQAIERLAKPATTPTKQSPVTEEK